MHKDTQISDILQRTDVTDDEKQKLFNTYFERYLELRRQKKTPVMKEQQQQQQAEPQLPDAAVVESIPILMLNVFQLEYITKAASFKLINHLSIYV